MTGMFSCSLCISLQGLPWNANTGHFSFATWKPLKPQEKSSSQFLFVAAGLAVGLLLQGLLVLVQPSVGGLDAADVKTPDLCYDHGQICSHFCNGFVSWLYLWTVSVLWLKVFCFNLISSVSFCIFVSSVWMRDLFSAISDLKPLEKVKEGKFRQIWWCKINYKS